MMRIMMGLIIVSLAMIPLPASAFVCTRVSDADGNETGHPSRGFGEMVGEV